MDDRVEPPLSLLEETAISAVRAAGTVLLEQWCVDRQIFFKGDIDLVTDADRRSEETIAAVLTARFPDHQILAEEGSTGGTSSVYRWIVDPLDGTTNYSHHYPHFAVSVALECQGALLVGVVYDPIRNELFVGRAGGGADLNGRPLGPSVVGDLLHALVATGFPYDRSLFGTTLRRWEHFVRRCQALRRDGSAALDICYVAAGRFDAFYEDHLGPWDTAAGVLIAREAGCTVTDYRGGEVDVHRGEVLVSNGPLHEAMLAGLATADHNGGS